MLLPSPKRASNVPIYRKLLWEVGGVIDTDKLLKRNGSGLVRLVAFMWVSMTFSPSPLKAEVWDTFSDTWVATDDLGRSLPQFEQTGPPRTDRTVGIFYYTWNGPHGYDVPRLAPTSTSDDQGVVKPDPTRDIASPFDISRILEQSLDHREWGPEHAWHHWGRPYFDYYVSDDEWVIRKHAQMLVDAGVDVLILDATNGFHYRGVYMEIFRIFSDIRAKGGRTPLITFNTGTHEVASRAMVAAIYRDLYEKGLYRDLWFVWKGKPLIMGNTMAMDSRYLEFFSMRYSWAWSNAEWFKDGKDRWPWLDNTPQKWGWHENPDTPEEVSVTTAQHPVAVDRPNEPKSIGMGKSYANGAEPYPPSPGEGRYFAEQWQRALEVGPEFIYITQWNEWTAQRFIHPLDAKTVSYAGRKLEPGESYFVDVYDSEFNRDIEPMTGGYGDNYYYQMIDGIRRYKGTRPVPAASAELPDGKAIDWVKVSPEYRDDLFDTFHRNHFGFGSIGQLTNTTGRNDIATAKVARDGQNLYFKVTTREPLTPRAGENWMELFIAVDGLEKGSPNWEGFHYRACLDPKDKEVYHLFRSLGGWQWQGLGKIEIKQEASDLVLTIPRKLLELDSPKEFSIRFKWSDNRQTQHAIDWLRDGDVAPNARFRYLYRTAN